MKSLGLLTPKEIDEGWHYCSDWDGLLVGPGTPEAESCTGFQELKRKEEELNERNMGKAQGS